MRRLISLLITLLAWTSLANATAGGEDGTNPVAGPPAFGVTLTCSGRLPSGVLGCLVERPVFVLGPVEVSVAVDAQVAFTGAARGHLAPLVTLAVYQRDWAAWLELRLPELYGLHPIGDPDWLRFGMSWRL